MSLTCFYEMTIHALIINKLQNKSQILINTWHTLKKLYIIY